MAYEIGYRRPPAAARFKKGSSGNPKGRPKGSPNFMTLLEQELAKLIVINENGKKKKVTRMQAMVKRMIAGGLQGDQKSLLTLVEIMRRLGQLEKAEVRNLLPENYEALLDSFIERRLKSNAVAPTKVERN